MFFLWLVEHGPNRCVQNFVRCVQFLAVRERRDCCKWLPRTLVRVRAGRRSELAMIRVDG